MFKNVQDSDDNRIDWGIILCVVLLAVIGLASIYVAASHDPTGNVTKAVITQLVWYVVGALIVVVIMQFDAEQLFKLAPYAYWFGIFLLFAVLFLYSRQMAAQNGAKSWFALGPLSFQPSEIMKPAYILMLARVIYVHNQKNPVHTTKQDWILLGWLALWTLPVVILLKAQNDFGTTIVFIAILVGMIVVSGITWKILAPLFIGGFAVCAGALLMAILPAGRNVLEHLGFHAYQFQRIDSWLHPETSAHAFQVFASMKAVGSGGLFGTGFNVSHVYVPVRESDMIFSVIGENFGFVGSTIVILIYLLLIYEMIKVTFETKNVFYAYISTGVIMMILFHVFENIGMSIGLVPMTGIPLPFISQGGSALIGNMIGIGLVMSMQFHNKSSMFSTDRSFS